MTTHISLVLESGLLVVTDLADHYGVMVDLDAAAQYIQST
jgi:hypothetical protein